MRIASYKHHDKVSYGAVLGGGIVDLAARHPEWPSLRAALAADALGELALGIKGAIADVSLDDVTLLAPVADIERVFCIGLNYRTHIAETGREPPRYPMIFCRYADSIVGHGEALLRPKVSQEFDFEGELAVVIGKTAHHVSSEEALKHVAGYTCFNDGSIRDFQWRTTQFDAGKNFWKSGSCGPWMTTIDELPDLGVAILETRLNGQVMQRAPLSDLLFDVPSLIAYLSQITPLKPGDIIATGTTGGIGAKRVPPVWMKAGDRVEIDIDRIGVLSNPVIDEGGAV